MPTTAQLNAVADALKAYAYAQIKQRVPSFEESFADSFVSNDLLLGAAKAAADALEQTK